MQEDVRKKLHSQRNAAQAKSKGYIYQKKYAAREMGGISFHLNKTEYADVFEFFERLGKVRGKNKWLIEKAREDIRKGL